VPVVVRIDGRDKGAVRHSHTPAPGLGDSSVLLFEKAVGSRGAANLRLRHMPGAVVLGEDLECQPDLAQRPFCRAGEFSSLIVDGNIDGDVDLALLRFLHFNQRFGDGKVPGHVPGTTLAWSRTCENSGFGYMRAGERESGTHHRTFAGGRSGAGRPRPNGGPCLQGHGDPPGPGS